MNPTTVHVLVICGTRPEAIKLSPVVRELRRRRDEFQTTVCVTAQHRDLLDQVLAAFSLEPEYDLDLMREGQTPLETTSRILSRLGPVLQAEAPHLVLVQGDTATTLCGAMAAFYQRIPVGHVEAGLRSGDLRQPFPEEMNRTVVTKLASLHFAPTREAAENLRAEGVSGDRIAVTGNTGIDALVHVADELKRGGLVSEAAPQLRPGEKLIVVSAHRRENLGQRIESICRALLRMADREDVRIVFPVHPNPGVQGPVHRLLSGRRNISLVEPLGYVPFVELMRGAHLLITDSGGIQEEAPSLGKPVLVMREKTERPEGLRAGTAKLVGTSPGRIVGEAFRLLDDPAEYAGMARVRNPYGDGLASERIADFVSAQFASGRDSWRLNPVRPDCPSLAASHVESVTDPDSILLTALGSYEKREPLS